MEVGAVFPQMEIDANPITIRDYALAVEQLEYRYLMAYEHVMCPGPLYPAMVDFSRQRFHEPLTLFAYLAGVTTKLEFITGILILPQRQIALVAKQAAEVTILTGGRLHLGVGVGWNEVEYRALGIDFHQRGKIIEEQIVILRGLFDQAFVTYQGKFHHLRDVGLNPRPDQRIPIWMGGESDAVLRRAAQLADGWLPDLPAKDARGLIQRLRNYVRQEGRDPTSMGIHGRVDAQYGDLNSWVQEANIWRSLNVTSVSLNTMGCGFTSIAQHIEALRSFKEALNSSTIVVNEHDNSSLPSR